MTHCICNKHTKYYNDIYEHTRNTHGQPSPQLILLVTASLFFTVPSTVLYAVSKENITLSYMTVLVLSKLV